MIHLKNGKVLFVKMVHYALVLMIELVQICKGKSMGISGIVENHDLLVHALGGIGVIGIYLSVKRSIITANGT